MNPVGDTDRLLLGGLMDATEPKRLLDGSGLEQSHFGDPVIRLAFDLLRRRAARHEPVGAEDLWIAGQKVNPPLFTGDDLAWLSGLQVANALTPEQWLALAQERKKLVQRRQLAKALRTAADEVEGREFSPAKTAGRLDDAKMQLLRSYGGNQTAEADPADLLETWERRVKSGKKLLRPFHVPILDQTFKGWPPKLSLVVGAPGYGKSTLIGGVILAQLARGERVGLFGLEDGYRWLTRRAMALALGLPLKAVGNDDMSPENWLRASEEGARLSALFKNLLVYKWSGIRPVELVQKSLSWIVNEGVSCVYVDNASSINWAGEARWGQREEAYTRAVMAGATLFRDVAEDQEVPHVIAVHTKREYLELRRNKPPRIDDAADSSVWEKHARFMMGVWPRRGELRITVPKDTEGEPNVTVSLDLHKEAGLINPEGGAKIDLDEEAKKEKEAKRVDDEKESVATSVRRAELRKKMLKQAERVAGATAEPKKDDAQATLLDVPAKSEPAP